MTLAARQDTTGDMFLTPRRRAALALIAGALVMELLIQQQVLRFYYTPLVVGLSYLVAAAAAGRKGAFWAPGIVTTCWGIAVLLGVKGLTHIDSNTSYYIAAAIGVVLALVLRFTVGLAAGAVGLAVSVAVIVLHSYSFVPSWVFHGLTFAVLLGVWGLWELRPAPKATEATTQERIPVSTTNG